MSWIGNKADIYTLRIVNNPLADNVVSMSGNNDSFTFVVPENLKGRGKCRIMVSESMVALRNAASNRVIPDNAYLLAIRSNIPMLGYNNETTGGPNILAEFISNANTIYAVQQQNQRTFTCPELPSQILIERMYYDELANFQLTPADNYTAAVVPLTITLQIEFVEDMDQQVVPKPIPN